MLVYHPAFDVNHGMFRLLRLLELHPEHQLEWDAYRILDFYYLFPHILVDARLTQGMTARKKAYAKLSSKYARVPSPRMFIRQMSGIHETIVRSLAGKGFLDPPLFDVGLVSRTDVPLPSGLRQSFDAAIDDRALVDLLALDLGALPVKGVGGLKERTGLLEHRYDAL